MSSISIIGSGNMANAIGALAVKGGNAVEVTIWWRPLPSGVQMQRHLAGLLGMQPWELRTNGE